MKSSYLKTAALFLTAGFLFGAAPAMETTAAELQPQTIVGEQEDEIAQTYTITFVNDMGSNYPKSITAENGSFVTIPMTIPRVVGYQFRYWYYMADTEQSNENGDDQTAGLNMVKVNPGETIQLTRDMELRPGWQGDGVIRGTIPAYQDVTIYYPTSEAWVEFIPKEDGLYAFTTSPSDMDTVGELLDMYGRKQEDDDSGEGKAFRFEHTCKQYTSYVTGIRLKSEEETGSFTLVIERIPYIVTNPEDVTLKSGQTARFHAEANGQNLQYRWYYSTDKGTTWKKAPGASAMTDTYETEVTLNQNDVLVKCVVTDDCNHTVSTTAAKIIVPKTIDITSQPRSVTIKEGEKATFKVEATGKGLTYQWLYSTDAGKTWKASTGASATTNAFSITGAPKWNGMLVKCEITDQEGAKLTSSQARLTVLPKPAITGQPQSITVNDGVKATFKVTATGDGLTYQWFYSKDAGKTWKASTGASATTSTFSITGAPKWNGMLVRCEITDKRGDKITSSQAKLTVKYAPVITSQPQNVTVMEGNKAKFKVVANGEGLTYQWYYSMDGGKTWKASNAASATTSEFTITGAAKWNNMQLKCVLTSAGGLKTTSNSAALSVRAALGTPGYDQN